jgi:hypothetical protein
MTTFVLVHGAGDVGLYWHLTEAELRARGHQTIAPDLPCETTRPAWMTTPAPWPTRQAADRTW